MAIIIGRVYYPKLETKVDNGQEKTKFTFSLASRKAFIEDNAKPNLFTPCVTYQPGLAKVLAEHFGKDEDHGRSIAVYGHFNEYEWYPDPANPDHDKYFQPFKITSDIFAQGNIKLAEGSAKELVIQVPIKQTTRQFVVSGFEFADSATTSGTNHAPASAPQIKVGVSAGGDGTPVNTDGVPF